MKPDLSKFTGFDWDHGNFLKSELKHGITPEEAESAFLDKKLLVDEDLKHQEIEERFIGIGKTTDNKILSVVFTLRYGKIRIISSRKANKKERTGYYEKAKENP